MAKDEMRTFEVVPVVPAANCHNCRYSGEVKGGVVCRFKPGTPMLMMQMGLDGRPNQVTGTLWPPVLESDWCKEWAAKLSG